MKLLKHYKNGNYFVSIFEDGTKIRQTNEDEFIPMFPENIDMKISDRCDRGCKMCHENSTKDGKIAHFNHKFLDTLKAGQEIAIGGGSVFENTELESFLIRMKNQGVFCNITIHQVHAEENIELISKWINEKLVRGVGISYNNDYEQIDRIFNKLEELNSTTSNIILHTINGIHNFTDLIKLNDKKNKKVLILGYKSVRRGLDFIQGNNDKITQSQQSVYNNLEALSKTFKVLSFDNLAIEQLEVKRIVPESKWNEFFMGQDSEFTMYLDLCKEDFAVNSCEVEHRHKLLDSIEDMFKLVKEDGIKYGYKKQEESV